jgi:hypothetical protein
VRHVITLSTIPPRFAGIGETLTSLVRQSSKPEAVELYIPTAYRRFPEWGGDLPPVPEGVRIIRVPQDFGPATKVLPAALAYRGQEVELLYADDDHFYAPGWAAGFLAARKAHPDAALCAAATTVARMGRDWQARTPLPRAVVAPHYLDQIGFRLRQLVGKAGRRRTDAAPLQPPFRKLDRSGFADIAEGYAGVALRPDFFDDLAFAIPPVAWAVDDVWLSGHLARRGIPIWADMGLNRVQSILPMSKTAPLYGAVIDGANRPEANLACVDHMRMTYGIWGGEAVQST